MAKKDGAVDETAQCRECARVRVLCAGTCWECDPNTFRGFEKFLAPGSEERIRWSLETSPRAIARAIVVLYSRQTEYERASKTTVYDNNRGFNKPDSWEGAAIAQYLLGVNLLSLGGSKLPSGELITEEVLLREYLAKRPVPGFFRAPTQAHLEWALSGVRPRIAKYVGQLAIFAKEERKRATLEAAVKLAREARDSASTEESASEG